MRLQYHLIRLQNSMLNNDIYHILFIVHRGVKLSISKTSPPPPLPLPPPCWVTPTPNFQGKIFKKPYIL